MKLTHLLAFALSLASSEAVYQGFNYASTNPDGSSRTQSDFQAQFQTAKNLKGTSGFTSARLYTMIQGGTTNSPISAIPAAIAEGTSLLLGLWASGGNIDNELAALKSAIAQYGPSLGKLVAGISVGSEDLYRNSPMGIKSHAGIGNQPQAIVDYINEVRSIIHGTPLSAASIGHVDTWTAWVNGSNADVINAVDWLGFDGYPYFQNTMANSISDGKALFDSAVAHTQSVSGGKEVWITETGWPVSGKTMNLGVPSIANAKTYWDQVGCPIFGKVNTWWYTLQDASGSAVPNPSFGVVGNTLSTTPLFDLSCSAAQKNAETVATGDPAASGSGSSSSQSSSSSGNSSGSGSKTASSSSNGSGGSSTNAGSSKAGSTAKGSSSSGASSTKASKGGKGASGFHTVATNGTTTATGGTTAATPASGSASASAAAGGSSSSPSATATPNGASKLSGSIFAVAMAVFALAAAA